MIDFARELESILRADPLGVLEFKPKTPSAISPDERLVASFKEINAYVREHGSEPTASRNINERKLFSRLKGLRESPAKAAALLEHDECSLLNDVEFPEQKEIQTISDVLEDDVLGLLDDAPSGEATTSDIFTLRNVPKLADKPDHVANRKPCKEFDQFEPLFQQSQIDLASGKTVTVPFNSERQIAPETTFILQGMMVYVANVGKWEKRNYGNVNARLYCVFDNGTESNMLLRSLAAALWKDENSRQVIGSDKMHLFESPSRITADDDASGYIYVLRSLSSDPRIREIDDLYKIGFSTQPVNQRIQSAAQDPTFLLGDVMPVTQFQTFNLNPQKLELLLHTFFAEVCLNLDVFDSDGKRHTPREWFVVPIHLIETAVQLLINGDIINYRYDSQRQEIVAK